jgi:hypothetical protein
MATIKKVNPFGQMAKLHVDGLVYFLANSPVPPAYMIEDIPRYTSEYLNTLDYSASNYPPISSINSYGIAAISLNLFYDYNNVVANSSSCTRPGSVLDKLLQINIDAATTLKQTLNDIEKDILFNENISPFESDVALASIAVANASLDYWAANIGSWSAFSIVSSPTQLAQSSMKGVIGMAEKDFSSQLSASLVFALFQGIENL